MREIRATYKKETANKFVWVMNTKNLNKNFYIFKWRVPIPTPKDILIKIYFPLEEKIHIVAYTQKDVESNPELRRKNIYSKVFRNQSEEHTDTVRFDPDGENENWEIGSGENSNREIYRKDKYYNLFCATRPDYWPGRRRSGGPEKRTRRENFEKGKVSFRQK